MHCVWSRWPAWSGSSRDRLQCTVPCSTSPTLSGISPTLLSLTFPELASPAADSRHRFLRLSACPYHNPTGPSADGLCRRFPWVVFDNPHRSAVSVAGFRCCFRRQIPAAFAVARLGFSQVSSLRAFIRNRRRDFHRFPWGNEGAVEAAPPEAAPLLGCLCFLSVIDGVAPYQNLISDETAWIKAVSLVFLRSIAWHRAAAPVVAVPIDHMLPVAYSQRLVVTATGCPSDWSSR